MKNTYFDLIEQSYYFPQEGFDLREDYLTFHGVSLKYLIEKSKWLRAPFSGMFQLLIENGTWVSAKTLLAKITDPYGDFEKKVYAPFDCYIFSVNTAPIVNKGDAIFHISIETI